MKKISLFLIGIFLMNIASADSGEDCGVAGGMMGGMTGTYGISGMLFGWLSVILFMVALVLLIVWLAKQIQKK